jgi:flavin reductase (DIM6/NTAB) family NADH-FMN oxidoreductase RutF
LTVALAHRLLAPRVAYLVGSRNSDGVENLIPVSNVTSISTDPQQVVIAIHKDWWTYKTLSSSEGFTISVPTFDHLKAVWRLGARYSRFPATDPTRKMAASGIVSNSQLSNYGPVLVDGIGWMECEIIASIDHGGNHGAFVGAVTRAELARKFFLEDGTPIDLAPLMQVSGNLFAKPGLTTRIAYSE